MPAGTQAHANTNTQAKVCTNKLSAQKLHRDRHTGLQANVCMHAHTETHKDKTHSGKFAEARTLISDLKIICMQHKSVTINSYREDYITYF